VIGVGVGEADITPQVKLPIQYGLTAEEANARLAELVETWIRQQADSDVD